MIRHCGTVWGIKGSSYIYAIFTDDFVYIGETGNLPPARWGSHLSKADSSFSEKLKTHLEKSRQDPYTGEYVYIGLYCEIIDRELPDKRRFARRAIEDEVHRKFYTNQNAFGKERRLLSTSSPPSSRIQLCFDVESFAALAIAKIAEEYNRAHHSLPKSRNGCDVKADIDIGLVRNHVTSQRSQ